MKLASLLPTILIGLCFCSTTPQPRAALAPADVPSPADATADASVPGTEGSGARVAYDADGGPPSSGTQKETARCGQWPALDGSQANAPGPGKAPSKRILAARVSSMQSEFRRKDVRSLTRRGADRHASIEERIYAHYLLWSLGDRAALQALVDEFPLESDGFWRLFHFGNDMVPTCRGVQCLEAQQALGSAAFEDVPRAREKLLLLRKVTDAGATMENEGIQACLVAVAPVDLVGLAACLKTVEILTHSIEHAGVPIGRRTPAIAALSSAQFSDPTERAAQALVLAELKKAKRGFLAAGATMNSTVGGELACIRGRTEEVHIRR